MSTIAAPPELRKISDSFEQSSAEDILRWAAAAYGERLTMATAFGAEGCVILAMLAEIAPHTRVFNLETGYQFRETLELRERIIFAGLTGSWVECLDGIKGTLWHKNSRLFLTSQRQLTQQK